jgi:predicted DNA-binding transcriptional regulator YafY
MRADRLLSLLMLLQTRGMLTAAELAVELQVTERTVYRDITALCTAGVPIYTTLGPGGGYGLLEDYRTNLTGLNPDEVRALFMLSIPAPLDQLGVGQELRAALLKLTAALPDNHRREEERSRQRIHLDSTWWFQEEESVPFLGIIHKALWSDHLLRIQSRSWFGALLDWVVAPYGLVAKASVWYLVFNREQTVRAQRISHITHAEMLPETFARPVDFDLEGFWKGWVEEFHATRPQYPVRVRVSPELVPLLKHSAGNGQDQGPATDPHGWTTLTLTFESFEAARSQVLAYGGACEVLEPLALRMSVADFANQVVKLYG